MKIKKILSYVLSLTIIAVCLFLPSHAHSTSQFGILSSTIIPKLGPDYHVGGEAVGWSINENHHTDGKIIRYYVHPSLPDNIADMIPVAAAKWDTSMNILEASAPMTNIGTILYSNIDSNALAVACVGDWMPDEDGHLESWTMYISPKWQHLVTPVTIAHEFGHVIGLNDLYDNTNIDKLMFGIETRTATNPTERDIAGAEVITGQHGSHRWGYLDQGDSSVHRKYCQSCYGLADETASHSYGYQYFGINSYGNVHRKYCTVCGYLTGDINNCSYRATDTIKRCIYCGLVQGMQPYDNNNPAQTYLN